TPANSRLDVTTNPDPNMQTTARDLGQLLGWVYACAQGDETTPLASYAEGLVAGDCTAVLNLMTGNNIDSLIEEGVPESVPIAHKHGWIGDTHGDAGVVFAPDGAYVIVMLLHKPDWLEWEESSPLMAEISRLAYGHFTHPEALYPADLVLAEPTAVVTTPTPDLPRAIVTGTQGIGLRLRQTPGGAEIAILPEGSVVLLLDSAPRDVNGTPWREVQTGAGETGWVGADYLITE
ncbi:MAG: serine hydrolase, partial [Anaerolineales bacterium]|nr:serine hydrolase [Anaerolineales bacterium]